MCCRPLVIELEREEAEGGARKVRYLVITPSLPSLKAARKALLKNV